MIGVAVNVEGIRRFCERYGVRELSLFGSVVRSDFGPDSDIDVLVEFAAGRAPSLFSFLDLQVELQTLLGRRVDLVSKRGLNPHLRDRILAAREVLYARP